MRSPALAFGWQLGRRHRLGLLASGAYLALAALAKGARLLGGASFELDTPESLAFAVLVPLTAIVFFLFAVFSFGLDGDLAGRRSLYPARLLALPVSTRALAVWPLAYGAAAITLLWCAVRLGIPWPRDVRVPALWPAALGVAALAWTQALTWTAYSLPGMRVAGTVLGLAALDAVALLALHHRVREAPMLAGLLPQVAIAYLLARRAVARARRGEVPDRSGLLEAPGRLRRLLPRRRRPFRSAAEALTWYERRRHGRSLPLLVAMTLPFELGLIALAGRGRPGLVLWDLVVILLTPPFLATFAAAAVRASGPEARDAFGLTPFLAARPVASATLARARLDAALASALLAWLLVLVATPVVLAASGTAAAPLERVARLAELVGTPRATAVVLLGIALLVAATWKQLVLGLTLGLTGRAWVVKRSVLAALAFLFALGPALRFLDDHAEARAALWKSLPALLTALACLKTGASVWVVSRLHRARLLPDRALVAHAAAWAALALGLYAFLYWLAGAPLFPHHLLGTIALLAVPFVRTSAATLALDWNRHR